MITENTNENMHDVGERNIRNVPKQIRNDTTLGIRSLRLNATEITMRIGVENSWRARLGVVFVEGRNP